VPKHTVLWIAQEYSKEHSAGIKMEHVDALRRHVGTIVQGGTLEKEYVHCEIVKETFCRKQSPGTYSNRKEYFFVHDGFLHQSRSNGRHQLILPATLMHEVISRNHDPVYVAHPVTIRTHDLIALHYWWPGMRKSIEDYVKNAICARNEKERASLQPCLERYRNLRPRSR